MKAKVLAVLSIGLLHGLQANAAETLSIESIAVQELGDTKASEITIRTTDAPEFTLFRLTNPTRVIVDLPGADVSRVEAPTSFAKESPITGITTTQFRGKTGTVGRVVVSLREDVAYDAATRGQAVVLTLGAPGQRAQVPSSTSTRASTTSPSDESTPVVVIEGEAELATKAHRLTTVSASGRDGGTLVHIKTDGEIERYEIEEVDNPPRLVVDLFGVKSRKNMEKTFDTPAIAGARIGAHHEKTRVVLDGRTASALPHYDVAAGAEGLTIMFNGVAREATGAPVQVTAIGVEEKRGFWRLKLDATSAVAVRTVGNGPREKTIALDGVSVAPHLMAEHRFAAGPISSVVVAPGERADTVHVQLRLKDEIEHSVWQKPGALYWDVRQNGAAVAAADRAQPRAAPYATELAMVAQEGAAAKKYSGRRITIDLQEADIINVLRLLGDVSGDNIVVGEDVKGKVTIKLKNVPWDQALDVILRTKQLGQERRSGIIRIAPQARLDEERSARLKIQEEVRDRQPTSVRLIPVNYAVASELVPQIKELLSKRGRATFDERTNVIIVDDVRDNLDQAEKLVRTLDTQTPLVLIEARMVEASTNFSRSLGIQWGGGIFFSQRGGNPTGLIFPNNVGVLGSADDPATLTTGIPGTVGPTNYAVNLPADAASTAVGMNLGAIGNYGFLNARLSAAETNGEAKTVSSPKVTTLNNKTAKISQGVQIPIQITLENQVQTTVLEANLELDVTPHVTADGSILMALKITNNAPALNNAGTVASVSTKTVETEMLVKDGDTAVLGGIYTRTYGETYQQTPFLGSIPVLGWLFKSYNAQDQRDEMLVFLTPRIINRNP